MEDLVPEPVPVKIIHAEHYLQKYLDAAEAMKYSGVRPCAFCEKPLIAGARGDVRLHPWCYRTVYWGQT